MLMTTNTTNLNIKISGKEDQFCSTQENWKNSVPIKMTTYTNGVMKQNEHGPCLDPFVSFKLVVDPELEYGVQKRVLRFDGTIQVGGDPRLSSQKPADPRDSAYLKRLNDNKKCLKFKPLIYNDDLPHSFGTNNGLFGSTFTNCDTNGLWNGHNNNTTFSNNGGYPHYNQSWPCFYSHPQQQQQQQEYYQREYDARNKEKEQYYLKKKQEEEEELKQLEQNKQTVQEIIKNLMPLLENDLKVALVQNLKKEFIERRAFKSFETWWTENENQEKEKQKTLSINDETRACDDRFYAVLSKSNFCSETDRDLNQKSCAVKKEEIPENELEAALSSSPSSLSTTSFHETFSTNELTDEEFVQDDIEVEENETESDRVIRILQLDHSYCIPEDSSIKIHSGYNQEEEVNNESVNEISNYIPKLFPLRSEEENLAIRDSFMINGIDEEDILFMKKAYPSVQKFAQFPAFYQAPWVDHPPTVDDPHEQRPHRTGCARTEGFNQLEYAKKKRQAKLGFNFPVSEAAPKKNNNNNNVAVGIDKTVFQNCINNGSRKRQATRSREVRSSKRKLVASVPNNGEESTSEPVKNNMFISRGKKLRFARSSIHDWGLFAAEPIAAGEMVIEYVGEKIRSVISDVRERQYEMMDIGSSYFFRLDYETVIDATRCGNAARFINHSCGPNCAPKIISSDGQKHIVIYSKQSIREGEEITYDYKFPIEEKKIPCMCGSSQCQGFLN